MKKPIWRIEVTKQTESKSPTLKNKTKIPSQHWEQIHYYQLQSITARGNLGLRSSHSINQTDLHIILHPKVSRKAEPAHVLCWLNINREGTESTMKSWSSNTKGYLLLVDGENGVLYYVFVIFSIRKSSEWNEETHAKKHKLWAPHLPRVLVRLWKGRVSEQPVGSPYLFSVTFVSTRYFCSVSAKTASQLHKLSVLKTWICHWACTQQTVMF